MRTKYPVIPNQVERSRREALSIVAALADRGAGGVTDAGYKSQTSGLEAQ